MAKKKTAIGQYAYYVHYHAANFEKQQALPGKDALSKYAIAKATTVSHSYRSKVSNEKKAKFAKLLSALMGRSLEAEFSSADKQQLQDAIVDSLEHGFIKGNDIVNWASGQVLGGRKSKNNAKQYKEAKRYLTEFQVETLLKQAKEINNNIQKNETSIRAKGGTDATTLDQLIQLLNGYDQALQNHLNSFKDTSIIKTYNFAKKQTTRINVGEEFSKKIIDINQKARELGLLNVILTAAQGELFEKTIKAAGDLMAGLSVKTICDSFKQGGVPIVTNNRVTGGKRVHLLWQEKGIPADTWAETLMKNESYSKTNKYGAKRISVSKNQSQIKTDVVIEFEDENPIEGTRAINISAKSGDLFSEHGIQLVSGTDLWYMIQDEDVKRFLRPYLNIMAEHENKNGDSKEKDAINRVEAHRADAILATKILTIWKALTGHTFGRYFATAQLLVLNDTKSKKIYIVEAADIINLLCKQTLLKNGTALQYFSFDKTDFENLYFSNAYDDESLHRRMAKLLNSVHQQKISVSMKGSILKDKNLFTITA